MFSDKEILFSGQPFKEKHRIFIYNFKLVKETSMEFIKISQKLSNTQKKEQTW